MEDTRVELEDFEDVVSIHWQRIYRFVLASVRDTDAARTLTQDCFLRAHSRRERFRGDASVKTWLMKIAINLVHDFCRNRRHQFWRRLSASGVRTSDISDHLPDSAVSPEARASLKEQLQAIWQASRDLPDRQRTVFLLRFVEDMDLLEIAAATGMKEGTVKTHLFRAIHAIRERLGGMR